MTKKDQGAVHHHLHHQVAHLQAAVVVAHDFIDLISLY
jgi:hypothetical protein